MERTHFDASQKHLSTVDGDVQGGSNLGQNIDPRHLSPSALGLPQGPHGGSQHSPGHGMAGPSQPSTSYNWRSFQNPIGQMYHDPNAVEDRWIQWQGASATGNQGAKSLAIVLS